MLPNADLSAEEMAPSTGALSAVLFFEKTNHSLGQCIISDRSLPTRRGRNSSSAESTPTLDIEFFLCSWLPGQLYILKVYQMPERPCTTSPQSEDHMLQQKRCDSGLGLQEPLFLIQIVPPVTAGQTEYWNYLHLRHQIWDITLQGWGSVHQDME